MIVDSLAGLQPWLRDLQWKTLEATKNKPAALALMSTVANATSILMHDEGWRGVIARNEFAERDETRKLAPWHPDDMAGAKVGPWTDEDTTRLRSWFGRGYGLTFGANDLHAVVAVVARANAFHPVREYLGALAWDQTERLPGWLNVYFNVPKSEYAEAIGVRWMISAVARVFEPGCQVDCTLILEGPQGSGKSSGIRALVPDPSLYSETGVTPGDKDSYQSLHGMWIYLLDELDSLRRSNATRTKNFLTSVKDHYRPSYGHGTRDFYRQNVFCGTTNDDQYLIDTTGNRRFWPVRTTGEANVAGLRAVRDQLWAEALVRYRRGEKWHVNTPELRALCEAEQEARTQVDPWTQAVAEWVQHPIAKSVDAVGRVHVENLDEIRESGPTTAEALEHAIGKRLADITRADEMRMGSILITLGLERNRTMRSGERVYRYKRPALPALPDPDGGRADAEAKNGCETAIALPALPDPRISYAHARAHPAETETVISGEAGRANEGDFTADLEELGVARNGNGAGE